MKFNPGPGLGGHCIPIDPLYLSWKLRAKNYTARFIDLASEINSNMPRFAVGKIQDALNDQSKALKGSKVLVLGASYKADIDDVRESPALDIIHLLRQKGAQVTYHDPFIKSISHNDWTMKSIMDVMEGVVQADCVVIVANHHAYDYPKILDSAKLIIDTRNALGKKGQNNPKVVRL
jgi:UDP-N-acetyl-D-glucosamine dehydrogenase